MNAFIDTVAAAVDLAESGALSDGYSLLLDSFEAAASRAQTGSHWDAEMLKRWRSALDQYCARFGVRMP